MPSSRCFSEPPTAADPLQGFVLRLLLVVGLAAACTASGEAPRVLATFTLHEDFGVSHPEQIVSFDAGKKRDAAKLALLDEQGKMVPFQVMGDGRIAVRTDLPAGAVRTWRLVEGEAPAAAGVKTAETPVFYEITNEIVGIRVPKATADLAKTPAPIQGLRFQDGAWTAVGPNLMARPAKAMSVEFLEKGPLVTRVRVSYVYDKAALHCSISSPDFPDVPAGEGPYTSTIEVQAGQPSITFEEECETDISYRVDVTRGLTPDKARYRGHHATSTEAGMDPDGTVYQYDNKNRHDAAVNLKYGGMTKDRWSGTTYPFMAQWDPWAFDTGFYWQLYDSRPDGSDHLLGIFAGPASRLIRPGLSGVSFDTTTVDGQPRVSLQVGFKRFMPTQTYTTHMRFGWGIFLGKKGADLKPPMEVQGINKQMNVHSGVNLNTISGLPVSFPDPKSGYGTLYAPVSAWKEVADALREEKSKGGKVLFGQQYSANPYLGTLLEFWADPSPESAKKAADAVTGFARYYLETLVNGEGIYEHTTHYFMGAAKMSGYLIWIDQFLASDQLGAEEKAKLKRAAALFATALWDHDVSPMQEGSGANWGPANMSSMWRGTRDTYTLFLADHPGFRCRVEEVRKEAIKLLHDYTNEAGACGACAHYTGATMVPILNLLQQMQMRGVTDAFATEKRLANYAEWEMQLLTPPEIRFGGLRKIIAVGDGCTEQSVRMGQIGTGFAKSNPALSARVMGAWRSMGNPQDNFFGASLLKIDPSLPSVSPKLGSANFEGWMSVMRSGWETPDESAVFFIHGDFLTDHRHDDQGEVILYALGAPLSLDFGSMYTPRSAGGLMHSLPLPESWLVNPWDADRAPLDLPAGPGGRSSWWKTRPLPFVSLGESASTGAQFSGNGTRADCRWQRTVRFLHPDPARPVIVIDDVFTGKDLEGKPIVSTLNLVAQGAVSTPSGPVTPEERTHPSVPKLVPDQRPSAGASFALPSGLNRFGFTGQWLIDWDLYTEAAASMRAVLGNWGHKSHPSGEQQQFVRAQGRPFEERQHLMRLRGQDRMRMILLPYRKGERPENLAVTKRESDTLIRSGNMTLVLTEHGFFSEEGERRNLTSFGGGLVEAFGVALKGGAAEVRMDGATGALMVAGSPGALEFRLPEGWKLGRPDQRRDVTVRQTGRVYRVEVTGRETVTLALERK